MGCRYSVPVAARVRYRVYRCVCGGWCETVETPVKERGREVGGLVEAAQRKRMAIIVGRKQQK